MDASLQIIILLLLIWSVCYFRLPKKAWLPILGIWMLEMTFYPQLNGLSLTILWVLYAAISILVLSSSLRRATFMPAIMQKYRQVLPKITPTEQIAIEAGEVWWEGQLFQGKPQWKQLLALPRPSFTSEEEAFISNQLNTLCRMIDDWDMAFNELQISEKIWNYLKQEKFFGLEIDKKYGGYGFSPYAHSCIVSQIASRSASVAISVMVPNSLGTAEFIQNYGTEEQKNYYLPRLACGDEISAFGLTAPNAGSDATAITDQGIVCKGIYDGKEVLGIRLNFSKRYLTLAPVASVLTLAFKLVDPDHLLGDVKNIGITLCIVPLHLPGVEYGERHSPLGLYFYNGPIRGKNVFIPIDSIIGGVENRGKGWYMLMEGLAVGRGLSLPAMSTGVSKIAYRMTGAYARVREQFNMEIGKFEGIEEAMAKIGGYTYLCEATRYLTTSAIDQRIRPALVTAITKYNLTELSRKVINEAMDIHAGRGIQMGPKNYLALFYQAAPIGITVEGANILTRNLIIFGQGAVRCHPYVRFEINAVQDEDTARGLKLFDQYMLKHVGYAMSNFIRVITQSLTGGRLIIPPETSKTTKYYYNQLTRMSSALAFVTDITLLTVRRELKRRERISARLGDVLSQLYLGSAVLKYFNDHGKADADIPFVNWTLSHCLYEIQKAFVNLFDNYPVAWVGALLRWLVFPWGRSYKGPNDQWDHQIATEMMSVSDFRERLMQFCFVDESLQDATGLMESTFKAVYEAAPLRKKLHDAEKEGIIPKKLSQKEKLHYALQEAVLTEAEIKLIEKAQQLCEAAIQVDEFEPKSFGRKSKAKGVSQGGETKSTPLTESVDQYRG